jgi:hypothetical protein
MPKKQVYKYRKYDNSIDDYVYSTRYATMTKINRIEAEPVYGTGIHLDGKYLTDGWTEKNFDPKR